MTRRKEAMKSRARKKRRALGDNDWLERPNEATEKHLAVMLDSPPFEVNRPKRRGSSGAL
jgi:hypothetical protein